MTKSEQAAVRRIVREEIASALERLAWKVSDPEGQPVTEESLDAVAQELRGAAAGMLMEAENGAG